MLGSLGGAGRECKGDWSGAFTEFRRASPSSARLIVLRGNANHRASRRNTHCVSSTYTLRVFFARQTGYMRCSILKASISGGLARLRRTGVRSPNVVREIWRPVNEEPIVPLGPRVPLDLRSADPRRLGGRAKRYRTTHDRRTRSFFGPRLRPL